jgi:hypothetical protein
MATPSLITTAKCLGCGKPLFTTGAEVDRRTEVVELSAPGDDRKYPPNLVRAWCIYPKCPFTTRPNPHRAIFVGAGRITGVVFPE